MKFIENISYGLHPNQSLDIYLPEGTGFPTYVYFHGGGFDITGATKARGKIMATYLAERGVAVVCIEYRKYPDAVYPEFIRDCAAATAWAYNHMAEYGANGKLFVGGSSAGGYASMMLCFDKRWLAPYKLPENAVTGYFHDAGQPTTHFNVLRERGIDPRAIRVDDAAPLYHIGEAAEYPPMHFVISDNDIENRYEQTMLVMGTLKHLGYDMSRVSYRVMHGKHCQYVIGLDENGESVFGRITLDFLKKFDLAE